MSARRSKSIRQDVLRAEDNARLSRAHAESARAEAETDYFRGVASSIPLMMPPNGGGIPNRLDTAWAFLDSDAGNFRWQNYYELAEERSRSRQLEKTNWLASATLDRVIERVLGTLILIEPTTGQDDFDAEAKGWLRTYWYTRACDVRNLFSLSELLHLFYRAKKRDGGVLLVLTENARHDPKLQIIEAQRIKTPTNGKQLKEIRDAGNTVVEGVEMDAVGAHVAYWISFRPSAGMETFTRVDERDAIYQFNTSRYSNVIGEPSFSGGYWLFDQIMGYLEAVVVAARVGACQAMIQHRENPGTSAAPNALGASAPNRSPGTLLNGQQAKVQAIVPGVINVMGLAEKMTAFNPSQPTQSFPDAIDVFARFVGVRFGLTLEDILLDFSNVNYSSSKAAKNASKLATAIEQDNFASQVISRIYQWALSKSVKNGDIKAKAPANFWDHIWIPPVWGSVDPLKDIQEAERAIALGVDARTYVAAERGYDFRDLCKRNGKDQELMVGSGLSTAIAVGNSGSTQPEGTADGKGGGPPDTAGGKTPKGKPAQQRRGKRKRR